MSTFSPPPWKSNGTYRSSPLPLTPPPMLVLPRLDLPPLTLDQQEHLVRRLYPAGKVEQLTQEIQKKEKKDPKFAFGRHFF
jgi:hypothetical protein